MTARGVRQTPVFRVIDALDAPHGGRILRLQLQDGPPPRVRDLRGSRLTATAPDGTRRSVTVKGFAAFGGRVSDRRLADQDTPLFSAWLLAPGTVEPGTGAPHTWGLTLVVSPLDL